ncbi:hypothetical protein ABIC22_004782 [Paenibacillus sp. PvP094]
MEPYGFSKDYTFEMPMSNLNNGELSCTSAYGLKSKSGDDKIGC